MTADEPERRYRVFTGDEIDQQQQKLDALIAKSAPLDEVSIAYARLVYLRTRCNKVKTADKLGIDRRTLYRWFADSE